MDPGERFMARNYKELQGKMNPTDVAENRQRVREELQRMALDELRNAKQLTQADMAELLNVPQSSISRIEQRTDMYLSTLRNYVQAMGGVLQIQAVFPEGSAVVINRFGEYEDQPYIVWVRMENNDAFQLQARPFHHSGNTLSTRPVKWSGVVKAMKALHLEEPQISAIRRSLQQIQTVEIGGRAGTKLFRIPDLVAAGFETTAAV
jgi:transcriptional regulator with XRE-family HTH domain